MTRNRFAHTSPPGPQDAKRTIGRTGPAGVGLTALCIVVLAAGCAPADPDRTPDAGKTSDPGKTLMPIAADWDSFDREVLRSRRPVLIEFSKEPCPPCVTQKAELELLAGEFGGQVTFTTLTLVHGEFDITVPKIQERYQILWLPTTILFVDGKERARWQNLHRAAGIREELKQALLETPAGR